MSTLTKEESVSLSFDEDEKDENDDVADISFAFNHTITTDGNFSAKAMPIAAAVMASSAVKKEKQTTLSLGVSQNRNKFMRSAPSLMRLLSIGQMSRSVSATPTGSTLQTSKQTTAVDNIFSQDTYAKSEGDMYMQNDAAAVAAISVQSGGVIDTLMSEYEKNATGDSRDSQIDLQQLAATAAQEFELLASQNDELFKDKEQLRQKLDDLAQDFESTKMRLAESEQIQQQYSELVSEHNKLQSMQNISSQEKRILQETVDDLRVQLQETIANGVSMTNAAISQQSPDGDDGDNDGDVRLRRATQHRQQELEEQLFVVNQTVQSDQEVIQKLESELSVARNEVQRLSENLDEQQRQFIALQESKNVTQIQRNRQLTLDVEQTNAVVHQLQQKQDELMQTIEEQKRYMQELEAENQELATNTYAKTSTMSTKKPFNMNRLRTKANVLSEQESFDADPFGGGDGDDNDEFGDAYDDGDAALYEPGDADAEELPEALPAATSTLDVPTTTAIQKQTPPDPIINAMHTQEDKITSSSKCACLFSFFDKFRKKPSTFDANAAAHKSPPMYNTQFGSFWY